MQVILKKDIKGLGKIGQIVKVKDGYGINFLIKNDLAYLANESGLKHLKKEIETKENEEQEQIKKSNLIKEKIEKITLEFKVKTGKLDKVFGSITSKQIADKLKLQNIEVDKKKINADNIDTLGIHNVTIQLYKTVTANLKVYLEKQ